MFKEVIHSHKIRSSISLHKLLKNLLQSYRNQLSRTYTSLFNLKHVWFSNIERRMVRASDPRTMNKEKTFYDYIIQIRFIFHKRTGAVARTQHIFIKAEKRS